MNLKTLTTEIGAALDTITGLRVYDYPTMQVAPPAAVVALPEIINYDQTYGNGLETIDIDVWLIISLTYDRTIVERLSDYIDVDNSSSIKNAIEGQTYTAADYVTVSTVEFEEMAVNNTTMIAALFTVKAGKS